MNSLRTRLLLVAVLAAAVAVLVGALFSRQVVTSEFRRYVGAGPVDLAPVIQELESKLHTPAEFSGADAVLERAAARLHRGLLLADSTGAMLAASAPPLRDAHVTFGAGGRLTVASVGRAGAAHSGLMVELIQPPSALVHAADGKVIGTLLTLPDPGEGRREPGSFLQRVNLGVWLGALAAVLVSAVLVWLLSGRIVGPIEALTAAARRMEGGDLTARVVPRGDDEVASLSRRFNAMAESLDRSFRLRRQLTHDVAHELRTPLTNLRAQVEALEDGLLTPGAPAFASLHEEVMLLASLVADLEQLAEAESGMLRLEIEALDAHELLKAAADSFAAVARERGLALERVPPAASGPAVRADPVRLGQMLRNLLANAIAHTPRGGRVTLSAAREGDRVAITVADTGAGIAPEHLPHVFERFYRADASRSRATGGAGLGLAIVQQLAIAHGGDVRAESAPGGGTRMTLRLPGA